MALQSSGAISISQIKTELGSSSNSLRTLSSAAGFTTPDAISEFYGYSAAQYYYWDLSNDIKWGSASDKPVQSNTEDFSMSLWIRPQWAATDLNLIIFDLTPSGTTSTANRFFLQYDYGLNRFNAMYRSNATNFNAQWALHSNNSATSTGTSSNDKWTAANRGDTNADGFINLVLTYDASESVASNAFKVYWNNRLITSAAVSNNGTRSNMTLNELTFCGNDHNTGGSRIADYMYMHMWDVVLRAADITAMYNSGAPISATDANITTNLIFADSSESVPNTGDNDGSGNYSFVSANSQSIVVI
jgi:hypothetical protein